MVLKPVDGSGGYGLVVGDQASDEQLAQLARADQRRPARLDRPADRAIVHLPRRWSTDGELAPRHVDLRPFAVNDGENIFVLPGGLTRVALPEGSLVVNCSQGGGSKDTWVVEDADAATVRAAGAAHAPTDPGPRVPSRPGCIRRPRTTSACASRRTSSSRPVPGTVTPPC